VVDIEGSTVGVAGEEGVTMIGDSSSGGVLAQPTRRQAIAALISARRKFCESMPVA
jgi:hypothetical protein